MPRGPPTAKRSQQQGHDVASFLLTCKQSSSAYEEELMNNDQHFLQCASALCAPTPAPNLANTNKGAHAHTHSHTRGMKL